PNTLQTAKPVTGRHQGSVVCQHLPADKDRAGRIVSPGEHIAPSAECVFQRETSLLRPVALCSAERTITSSVGLDVFETRSQSKDLSLGSAAPIQLAPTNKQRGDWTAQNKLFETMCHLSERLQSSAGPARRPDCGRQKDVRHLRCHRRFHVTELTGRRSLQRENKHRGGDKRRLG
ncbi:hypothetical protein KUCAC02_001236, partial [Chaenocephalus aceratus]